MKAARGAHIALSVVPTMTRTETWEIGLQAGITNKENYIRDKVKGGKYLKKNEVGGLLDKNVFKTFWISWADNVSQ